MRRCRGLTIIEVLVIVAIVGMLLALLLPAVMAARESARRMTCKSNLHEIGLAVLQHEAAYRRLPSGGWGFRWQGDPDRGTGPEQPGSWIFNVLRYLERGDIVTMGAGQAGADKRHSLALANKAAVEIFNCPTRRAARLYPYSTAYPPHNADSVPEGAKSDYAVNGGDVFISPSWPPSYDEELGWAWTDTSNATGVTYYRSAVRVGDVRDGTSYTYLVGEKVVKRGGGDTGDDQGLLCGYDLDTVRWTLAGSPPVPDSDEAQPKRFGSAHAVACEFVMCDGSSKSVSYGIDPEIHRRLGDRQDGNSVNPFSIGD